MLKDITLGQYFPGNSVVHRLDPRTKLILGGAVYRGPVLAKCFGPTRSGGPGAGHLRRASPGCRLKSLVRGLKPVAVHRHLYGPFEPVLHPGRDLVAVLDLSSITRRASFTAVFMVLRIILLIMGTFLLTYTTTPIL